MLDSDYQRKLHDRLSRLPCGVQLPRAWAEFFARRGHLPSIAGDQRRHVRKHHPGLAILEVSQSLPNLPRENHDASVLTNNISCSGISFLHTEQLFPAERAAVCLSEEKRAIEIARCRRIADKCWEVGARFV